MQIEVKIVYFSMTAPDETVLASAVSYDSNRPLQTGAKIVHYSLPVFVVYPALQHNLLLYFFHSLYAMLFVGVHLRPFAVLFHFVIVVLLHPAVLFPLQTAVLVFLLDVLLHWVVHSFRIPLPAE